jgi:GNAT superfamily N-acetyltransferase
MAEAHRHVIEKLNTRFHNRTEFRCGLPDLDIYLQRFAGQNEDNGVSQHYVAVSTPGSHRILGYYCLSGGSVMFEHLTQAQRKRLPRYPIPVVHLGRLAVDESAQGWGLGASLLIDALRRTTMVARQIGVCGMEVLAINDQAKSFYLHYGFTPLEDDQQHLYLPISAIRKLGLI